MATADDYLKNAGWVQRTGQRFDMLDVNKNGTIELADFQAPMEKIINEVKPDAAVLEKYRAIASKFTEAMGIGAGKKLNKDEFTKNAAAIAVAESAKKAKGEKTVFDELDNACYDIVDKNKDGFVTLNEFLVVMKATGVDAKMAEEKFKKLDANGNGKIERQELINQHINSWCSLGDK